MSSESFDTPAPSYGEDTGSLANGNSTSFQNAKDSFVNTATSAANTIQNHPVTHNVMDTVQNGPVAQNVKAEGEKTSNEFRDLADARTIPEQPAATGQPLTHYHSLFYRLLSWKNPRATAITYLAVVVFIFTSRYLHVLRYVFKGLYIVLGITAAAEVAGKTVFGQGFASQVRPKKYATIPKESLERSLDDAEQLINFFVIEFQRILFAENVYVTIAAFFSALVSYGLIKFVPLWGLSLLGTSVLFLAPLVYIKNQEFIDAHIQQGTDIVVAQTKQVRDVSSQYASRASDTARTYAGEYSNKAQQLIGSAKQKTAETSDSVQSSDFPTAPKEEPIGDVQIPHAQPEPELA